MLKVSEDGTWLGIRSRTGIRLAGIVCSILAAWVVRAVGTLFGADFVVADAFETLYVNEAVCANFAFQVGIKGFVMILILERLIPQARTVWTVGAWTMLVISYWPIVTVEATLASKIFLALINTATAVVVISAVRSSVRRPEPGLHPAVRGLLAVVGLAWAVYSIGGITPVVSYHIAPVTLRIDAYLLPVIALVALLSLALPAARESLRDRGGRVRATV